MHDFIEKNLGILRALSAIGCIAWLCATLNSQGPWQKVFVATVLPGFSHLIWRSVLAHRSQTFLASAFTLILVLFAMLLGNRYLFIDGIPLLAATSIALAICYTLSRKMPVPDNR